MFILYIVEVDLIVKQYETSYNLFTCFYGFTFKHCMDSQTTSQSV